MAENFYTILTATGKAKLANSAVLGSKVNFKTLKVGDGKGSYYEPTENQTALLNEVWSGNIGSISVDENNPNWIVTETLIPATIGGFFIREAGIFDEDGDLIAISKLSETYKPVVSEGSIKDLCIKIILEVSNVESVTLKIDPTVIVATRKDIQNLEAEIKNDVDVLEAKIQDFNTQLSDVANNGFNGMGKPLSGLTDMNSFTNPGIYDGVITLSTSILNMPLYGGSSGIQRVKIEVTYDELTKIIMTQKITYQGGLFSNRLFYRTRGDATTWGYWVELAPVTDSSRTTTAKDITGAINELNSNKAPIANPNFTGQVKTSKNTLDDGSGDMKIANILNVRSIENGSLTTPSTAYIDFHTSGNNIDFDSRIEGNGGGTSNSQGTLNLIGSSITKNGHVILEALNGGYKTQEGQTSVTIVTAGTQVSVSITFPAAFGTTPYVFCSITTATNGTSGYLNAVGYNPNINGFTLICNAYLPQTITVNWLAIGN